MSYEGYSQLLCRNGHQWSMDATIFSQNVYGSKLALRCSVCGEQAVWANDVDETNGCDKPHFHQLGLTGCSCGWVALRGHDPRDMTEKVLDALEGTRYWHMSFLIPETHGYKLGFGRGRVG